ncbi:MAG: DUF6483 family protein [Chloroflexota bacterium]|nr:DUF6483 family protein [Chloroflexota bacterium]
MIKQDYILRLIEQLVQTLYYSLGLTKSKDFSKALEVLDRAFTDFFGWDSNFVNSVPEEYLVEMLKNGGRLDVDNITVLAVLLKAEGDIYAAMDESAKAYHRHLRALHLFLTVSESNSPTLLPAEFKQIEEVLEVLAAYHLPSGTLHRLWKYHLANGDYARAEDMLWELLDTTGYQKELLAAGINFYRELLARSDEELAAGHLPRTEIQEGLAELHRMEMGD